MSSSSSYACPKQSEQYPARLTASTIQAALFASFLSTFLIQTLTLLQPDPLDAIQDILLYQTLVMQNSTSGPYVASVFSPPPYAVAINALFFASLGIILVAAFLCMLVKGWIRELDRKLQGIPDLGKRAVVKELREQGLARWRLPEMIVFLPSLIHISLLLFSIGLALYLLQVHPLLAFLSISIFGLGMLVYLLSIFISAIDDFSPFRSIYSRALGVLYRRLYPLVMPVYWSALPQTTLQKIREFVTMFIYKHEPLSEQAILDPLSFSMNSIIIQTSVTIFNKIWSPVKYQQTSVDAKNVSKAILLELNLTHIRPSRHRHFPLHYVPQYHSIKDAEDLAYSVCMMRPTSVGGDFVFAIQHVIHVLKASSDPWHHLVASLTNVWVEGVERILPLTVNVDLWIAGHKEDILHAISNIGIFSEEQWCFVLSSIYALIVQDNYCRYSTEIHARVEILARLLLRGVYQKPYLFNYYTDFWLYVTMSVLDEETATRHPPQMSEMNILHERDISAYGCGMTRDPENFRRLLRLSESYNLVPSMRQCLISILYILLSAKDINQQEIRLVDQYIEIIVDEMDVTDWSLHLSGLLTNEHIEPPFLSQAVLCLLEGKWPREHDGYIPNQVTHIILQGYDSKLSTANAQLTPSILKVMNKIMVPPFQVTGLGLQDPWLSLYTSNLAYIPLQSDIPLVWSPDYTSIASGRLDLYDKGVVAPETEMHLINTFLSCSSPSIACRALRWYLRLQKDGLASGDTHHFSTIFPIIFRKSLSTDEIRITWSLLVDVLVPRLSSMSSREEGEFAEAFFGYGSLHKDSQAREGRYTVSSSVGEENISDPVDVPAPMAADGLGWMEDVWIRELRSLVDRVQNKRPGLIGVMHATYPWQAPPPPFGLEGPQTLEDYLVDSMGGSAQSVLRVLKQLLKLGPDPIPAELRRRVGISPLLSDPRLQDDAGSIKVILDIGVINTASIHPSHASSVILNPST